MSRLAIALAAGALAVSVSLPVSADVATNHMGIPIAPNGGKASLHQWGGVDDAFAVNPDGDEAAVAPRKAGAPSAMARSHDDQDSDDGDDPDADTVDEVLAI